MVFMKNKRSLRAPSRQPAQFRRVGLLEVDPSPVSGDGPIESAALSPDELPVGVSVGESGLNIPLACCGLGFPVPTSESVDSPLPG